MSKIGVGIGEDFPVDDGGGDERADYEAWKRRRDEWRAKREKWRADEEEWRQRRAEWRARRRAFKEKVRAAARETFGPEYDAYRDARSRYGHYWPFPFSYRVMRILGVVLLIALVAEIFRAPLLFLALAGGAWFFVTHRHHRYAYGCDYDFDAKPRPQEPPQTPPEAS